MRFASRIQSGCPNFRNSALRVTLGVWIILMLVAVILQIRSGAYMAGFGGHPDEGAHFVTGLMVRDYLVSGFPGHPVRFAENYYAHYPKVAIGHYPPAFYLLEGMWLTVLPVSRTSVMILMAVLSSTFGMLVRHLASCAGFGEWTSGALGLFAVILPLTQSMSSVVMADLLLAVLILAAALAFSRYLGSARWRDSLAFGLLAAAATMTKGSGLMLALLPGLSILAWGRFRLLTKGSLWLAVVPVLLICLPWMWFSSSITAEGMGDQGLAAHLSAAIPYFGRQLLATFGGALLVPALIGFVRVMRRRETRNDPVWAVIISLPVVLVVFYSLIPAGLEPRYLLPAVPSVLVLAAEGVRACAGLFAGPPEGRVAIGCGMLVAGLFLLEVFRIPPADFVGFPQRVGRWLDSGSSGTKRFLVSSDARGEGAFISEIAIRDPDRPSHTVERGSKVLAGSDWLGRGYEEKFGSDEDLADHISRGGYDAIIVDRSIPQILRRPHHQRLERLMAGRSGDAVVHPEDGAGEGRGCGFLYHDMRKAGD